MNWAAGNGSKHVEAGGDDETQAPVGLTQGVLDRLRGIAAGENEAGVTGAFGKGLEFLLRLGSDHNVFDAGNAEGGVKARHVFEKAGTGNGQHHGAGSGLLARQGG